MGKLQIGPKDKGGEEETSTSKGKRATTTIQIPRELDLRVTEYATRLGISKAEAMDRLFRALYPEGVIEAPGAPIAPEDETEETIAPGTEALSAPPTVTPETSQILKGVAEDLRTVNTIKQLNRAIREPDKDKISAQDALELKKIEKMFGSTPPVAPQTAPDRQTRMMRSLYRRFQTEVGTLKDLLTKHMEQDIAKERDFYKSRLEEREAEDKRQAEIQPIYERLDEVKARVDKLAEEKEGKEKPPTAERREELMALNRAIDALRLATERLAEKGKAGEAEKLSELVDSLGSLAEKIAGLQAKLAGKKSEAGELDYKTVAITTAGEVAQELIGAYRDIEAGKTAEGEGEKPPAERELIERRVYNYAMKKIAAGQLEVDPYKAAEELRLTPNQVWNAIENLKKRGALVVKPSGGAEPESRRSESPGHIEEGIIEPPE